MNKKISYITCILILTICLNAIGQTIKTTTNQSQIKLNTPPSGNDFEVNFFLDDDTRWQFMGASQNYGTNYALFAQLTTDNPSNPTKIIGGKFYLRNFKGQIKLGLKEITIVHDSSTGITKVFYTVKALYDQKEIEKQFNVPLEMNELLISERIIEPMFEINEAYAEKIPHMPTESQKQFLKINDKYYSVSYKENRNGEINNPLSKRAQGLLAGLWDTEFFYIDGDRYIIPRYDYDNDPENRDGYEKIVGFRCKQNNNKLYKNN